MLLIQNIHRTEILLSSYNTYRLSLLFFSIIKIAEELLVTMEVVDPLFYVSILVYQDFSFYLNSIFGLGWHDKIIYIFYIRINIFLIVIYN